ncbi:GATA type transcriptional activator of nitrogen-regulated proteins [Hypoxylon texense]
MGSHMHDTDVSAAVETGDFRRDPAGRALRERFGCERMDKAYFCGSLQQQSSKWFGADVEVCVEDKKQRGGLLALGFEKAWVTDYLGIKAMLKFENAVRF